MVDAGRVEDFHIIDQAFTFSQHHDFDAIDAAALDGAIVQCSNAFDICPRGFVSFIAVAPVGGQAMVAVRVDEFEAAAAPTSPLTPTSAAGISHFVRDD